MKFHAKLYANAYANQRNRVTNQSEYDLGGVALLAWLAKLAWLTNTKHFSKKMLDNESAWQGPKYPTNCPTKKMIVLLEKVKLFVYGLSAMQT